MTQINRVYNANDLLHEDMNPVTVDVMTDSTDPDTVELTFTRNNNTSNSSVCTVCQYKFDKADIQQLYDYLGDAISWLDYQDSQNGNDDNGTAPEPVPPGPSDCDKNPNCTSCVGTNIPTPPLGPYDPDFWPTNR